MRFVHKKRVEPFKKHRVQNRSAMCAARDAKADRNSGQQIGEFIAKPSEESGSVEWKEVESNFQTIREHKQLSKSLMGQSLSG